MIDLTPLEVRQKKGDFRHALRGYDPELVNDFLDLVADRLEDLVKENMALRETARATQDELTAYRQKEQALSEALMAAQRVREDARSHAEKERELVLREAQLAASSARVEASRQIAREEEALRQVRARRAQLVESFRRLLERELAELAVIEETLDLSAREEATSPAPQPPAGTMAVETLAEGAGADELSAEEALAAESPAETPATEEPAQEATDQEDREGAAAPTPFELALATSGPELTGEGAGEPLDDPGDESDLDLDMGDEALPERDEAPAASAANTEGTSAGPDLEEPGAKADTDEAKRDDDFVPDDEDVIDLPEDWLSSLMQEKTPPRE